MNPEGRRRRIPDITLEQYLLAELPKSEMAETRRILEEDESLQARLEELKRSNREILERYPPNLMSRRIEARLDRQTSQKSVLRPWPMTALLAAAVALFLLVFFLPHELITTGPGEDAPIEQIKGEGPRLELYRKTQDGSESLEDGARAYPGDVIRIGYQAAGRSYGVFVSVDGRGTITLHLPNKGDRSVRLKNSGRVLLDFALELDDAPRWERFYFVCSDAPFAVAPVVRAAGKIDTEKPVDQPEKLDLPENLDQFVVSLEKGIRR